MAPTESFDRLRTGFRYPPEEVESRSRFGDCESKWHDPEQIQGLQVRGQKVQERMEHKSRYLAAGKLRDRRSGTYSEKTIKKIE